MEERELIYSYVRNGQTYVTPSLSVAWDRMTEGEIETIYDSYDERTSD
jgi:hypothetical protein